MKLKRVVALLLALMMLFLVACSSAQQEAPAKDSAATPDASAGEDKTPADTAETPEVVELRFHDIMPDPNREAYYQEVIARFNEEHPDIKVVYESTPWDQAHNKLVTLGSSDTLPDVTLIHPYWYSEFTSAGWVISLDDYIDNQWEHEDNLIPFVRNVLMDYDQKYGYGYNFGIPAGVMTYATFVRTDWLEEIGMTVDDLSTWAGIFEAAEKMTDAGLGRYGYAFRGARAGAATSLQYVWGGMGGKMYDENGVCQLNTPGAIEAMETYSQLYLNGFAPPDSVNWGYAEMVQGFTSGLTGILHQTVEVVKTCEDTMEDGTWTTVPFPSAADGNVYCGGDAMLYSITSGCEYPDQAWEFIEYLTSPDNMADFCEKNLYIPIYADMGDNTTFTDGPLSAFLESLSHPNFVRGVLGFGYFPEAAEFSETIFDAEFQRYLLGQQSVEEFTDYCADFLTTAQQAYMETNPDTPIPSSVTAEGTEIR